VGLRSSLIAGAIYDALLGFGMLLQLQRLADFLSLKLPPQLLYPRSVGVLLVALGLFYFLAAADCARSLRGAAGAVVVRAGGGAFVLGHGIVDGEFAIVGMGLVDLAWAALHLVLLQRASGRGLGVVLLRG
jgi:hypothetical protein